MCSTPKRTGIMFRVARIEEDEGYADYASMLRRASERMDQVQREREAKQADDQAMQSGPSPEPNSDPEQTDPRPSFLFRLWDYLNKPHYIFR